MQGLGTDCKVQSTEYCVWGLFFPCFLVIFPKRIQSNWIDFMSGMSPCHQCRGWAGRSSPHTASWPRQWPNMWKQRPILTSCTTCHGTPAWRCSELAQKLWGLDLVRTPQWQPQGVAGSWVWMHLQESGNPQGLKGLGTPFQAAFPRIPPGSSGKELRKSYIFYFKLEIFFTVCVWCCVSVKICFLHQFFCILQTFHNGKNSTIGKT